MRASQWFLALVISVVVHCSAAAGYWLNKTPEANGANGLGQNGVEIGLGLRGSYAEQSKKEKKVKKIEKQAKNPVVKKPNKVVKSVSKPRPNIAAVTTTQPKTKAVLVQRSLLVESANATQQPEPKSEQESNTEEQAASAAMVRGGGKGSDAKLGGKVGKANYFSSLLAWLNKYKDYPAAVKRRKQQGIVELKFSINKEGELLASSVYKSSGYPMLDKAALNVLNKASPMPAIPDSMLREQLTLVVPIEYSLVANLSYH